MNILQMSREELLALKPEDITRPLTPEEIIYIASALGAFWKYDYDAAKQGRVGMHAILKSGRHSDGFFISRILLEPENIRLIMADQIVRKFHGNIRVWPRPDYVAGVPDGATKLGEDIARLLGSKNAVMEKHDGRISLVTEIESYASVLLVEDFCTRGTGFKEAVNIVVSSQPRAGIIPIDPVILNRGGLETIIVENVGTFLVLPVVEWRVQDWDPADGEGCPLCKMGSVPMKPKATDENWRLITASQA